MRLARSPKLGFVLLALTLAPTLAQGWQDQASKPAGSEAQQPTSQTTPQLPPKREQKPAAAQDKSGQANQQPPGQQTPAPQQGQKPPAPPQPAAPGQLQLQNPTEAPTGPPPEAAPGKPAAPVQAQPEQPKVETIEEILFRGNRRITQSTLRARIFSHAGDVYDENALERDFMALWNTGYFDDIRLESTDGKNGKIVTFYVREKKLVRSIDYKGLSTVQQSDVLDRFKEKKVGLSIESQYDPVIIKRAEVVLEELLAEHGRQFATVRARTRNIPPNSVALTFIVMEGPKVQLGDVRFSGNTVFTGKRLVRAMKYSRPIGLPPWFYIFHRTYDKDKIEADLENIRTLYQEHGYFTVVVKEPTTKMTDTRRRLPIFFWSAGRGKKVNATIPLEEGPQYRLGRFVIRGNKLLKQEQLARILPMKTGDIFNLSKVRKSLEDYKKLYGEFGYINFVATPDPERDDKRHTVSLALDFDEGKQFFVHRIEFAGNTKTRDKIIRRELMLNEGEVFNTALWDYSTLRINQLGFFEQIKKEDYEVKQNAKDGTVDINLKVKEKGRNSIGFSGGISGISGNFVGINYSTNNFLGLGETLSVEFQVGTFERLYQFGFTEPYLFDRPIQAGFTIFRNDYKFDQLREYALYSGINPNSIQQTPYTQLAFQNYQQNSDGFTTFATYPLRRSFARLGFTYSFSRSSLQTFSAASQAYFNALSFRSLAGPNALNGIISSSVMPTYLYNTVDNPYNPKTGKYIYAGLSFAGSVLGGNVNTIRPTLEFKYFHPINKRRNTLGFHVVGSIVTGFGGLVPPPFSRFYSGGENDIRGYDPYSVSPVVFFPTIGQVCNRDSAGNQIMTLDSTGKKTTTCGSYTQFPYNTIIFPGGDTQVVTNFEYRVPIVADRVSASYFIDIGENSVLRPSQLALAAQSLSSLETQFPYFTPYVPKHLNPIAATNFRPRSSTGLQVEVVLPIVNAPIRVFYGYNWLRVNSVVAPPAILPPLSMFPNQATYNDVIPYFRPFSLRERKGRLGFTINRTF